AYHIYTTCEWSSPAVFQRAAYLGGTTGGGGLINYASGMSVSATAATTGNNVGTYWLTDEFIIVCDGATAGLTGLNLANIDTAAHTLRQAYMSVIYSPTSASLTSVF